MAAAVVGVARSAVIGEMMPRVSHDIGGEALLPEVVLRPRTRWERHVAHRTRDELLNGRGLCLGAEASPEQYRTSATPAMTATSTTNAMVLQNFMAVSLLLNTAEAGKIETPAGWES